MPRAMAPLEWTEDLSVSVREIDEQHRELLRMLNTLDHAIAVREPPHIVRGIIGEMMDYTAYHFSTEERYMFLFLYPEFHSHVAAHEEFVHQVARFQEAGEAGEVPPELQRYLSGWLPRHIMEADKPFGPCFRAHGLA